MAAVMASEGAVGDTGSDKEGARGRHAGVRWPQPGPVSGRCGKLREAALWVKLLPGMPAPHVGSASDATPCSGAREGWRGWLLPALSLVAIWGVNQLSF